MNKIDENTKMHNNELFWFLNLETSKISIAVLWSLIYPAMQLNQQLNQTSMKKA